MPTLQSSTHHPDQLRMRLGAGLAVLAAIVAIGAIALLVALTGGAHARPVDAAIHRAQPSAHTRSVTVIPAGFSGFYEDPATHTGQRVRTTTRKGWPTLASVLAPLTPEQRQYVLGIASLSDAQLAAAFGTGR